MSSRTFITWTVYSLNAALHIRDRLVDRQIDSMKAGGGLGDIIGSEIGR